MFGLLKVAVKIGLQLVEYEWYSRDCTTSSNFCKQFGGGEVTEDVVTNKVS